MGFNHQGGNGSDNNWSDYTPSQPFYEARFGLSFKKKVLSTIPIFILKEKRNESPVIGNVIHSTASLTSFTVMANEVGGGEQSCRMKYLAIGY